MMNNLILRKLNIIVVVFLSFKKDSLDKDLFNKCKKFKYDISNFNTIKYFLESISETRKNQKKVFNE